jgi:hypothetical protein
LPFDPARPNHGPFNDNVKGRYIAVWWADEETTFICRVTGYNARRQKHKVMYNDKEPVEEDLSQEAWRFVEVSERWLSLMAAIR